MSEHHGLDGQRHKRRQARPDDPMFGKLFFVSIIDPVTPSGVQPEGTDIQEDDTINGVTGQADLDAEERPCL